jgi:hypothetical protein
MNMPDSEFLVVASTIRDLGSRQKELLEFARMLAADPYAPSASRDADADDI